MCRNLGRHRLPDLYAGLLDAGVVEAAHPQLGMKPKPGGGWIFLRGPPERPSLLLLRPAERASLLLLRR